MPGVYKEKECPTCGELHRRRGQYCSQSCAGTGKTKTTATKKKISRSVREYTNSPEGIANAKMNSSGERMPVEEFAVSIPDFRDIRDYDFLDDYPTDW
jgi:hypothetical protein